MSNRRRTIFWVVIFLMVIFLGLGYFYVHVSRNNKEELIVKNEEENLLDWENKIETDQILKIGVITDTHIHPNRIDKNDKTESAPRKIKEKNMVYFRKFDLQMKEFLPDIVVHLGDVIEGTNDEDHVGIAGLQLVQKELSKSNVPIEWLIGNHDLRSVSKSQFKEALSIDSLNRVVDHGDYRLIFLDANYDSESGLDMGPEKYSGPGYLHPDTILWLEDNLRTDKRVFVFIHQPLFDRAIEGEKYFKNSISNAADVSKIIEDYNVEAVFNGHIEVKIYEEKNGVKYYSFPGTKKSKLYPQSYYELIIDSAIPNVRMFYTDTDENLVKSIDFEE